MIKPLILTAGDPAGIAGEITLKAWESRNTHHIPVFAVHGNKVALEAQARTLDLNVSFSTIDTIDQAEACFTYALPVIEMELLITPASGESSEAGARLAANSLTRSLKMALQGDVSGIVTNPVSKEALHAIGFPHPGQTEYFATGCECSTYAMMLSCPDLRVVPQTIHLPLTEVSENLSTKNIITTLHLLDRSLRTDFAVKEPRIAVAGLNPHAGEGGAFGTEDRDVIAPAIATANLEGLKVTGPLPADTMFHAAARCNYDIALCMYHDQALIPVKTLGFDQGVNTTLGLPIVRTSPDHGTAFNIAGKGLADPGSLIAALKLAGEIAENRANL